MIHLQSNWGRDFGLKRVVAEYDEHIQSGLVDILEKGFEFILCLVTNGSRTGRTTLQSSPTAIFFTIGNGDDFLCVNGGCLGVADQRSLLALEGKFQLCHFGCQQFLSKRRKTKTMKLSGIWHFRVDNLHIACPFVQSVLPTECSWTLIWSSWFPPLSWIASGKKQGNEYQ